MKDFRLSIAVSVLCCGIAAWWGAISGVDWLTALTLVVVLGVMEVSLSFDNAVVNASVLKTMDARWQMIFLTVGMLVAVFGMRLLFPIAIVAVATGAGMGDVVQLALHQPAEYARHLEGSHVLISAFGGMFLLLVFLSFVLDEGKELHWLRVFEERLAQLGRLKSVEIMVALAVLFGMQQWMPLEAAARLQVLTAGVAGILLFIAVSTLDELFDGSDGETEVGGGTGPMARSGAASFVYLEVLDASFSFDGVIGAFAITRDVVIIMLGLAVGAMFVRSLTVHLVKRGTLDEYIFLEHGAHYGIGALALIMLASISTHISEVVTGLVGVTFIALSLMSSIRHRAREATNSTILN